MGNNQTFMQMRLWYAPLMIGCDLETILTGDTGGGITLKTSLEHCSLGTSYWPFRTPALVRFHPLALGLMDEAKKIGT